METTVTEHDGEANGKTENRSGLRLVARRFLPVVVILVGLLLGYLLGLHRFLTLEAMVANREYLKSYVGDNFITASVIYFVVYTAAVAFAFPAASLLTILGGFLFGWIWGGLLTAVAATIGATVLFLAAKTALGDLLKKKAGAAVSRAADNFQEDAFGYLLVLRLAPIFPFFAVNIAPAFFSVSLRTYVLATLIGILPGTFAYAYLGETEKAKAVFRDWLAEEPGEPTAEHHLAALEGRTPDRAALAGWEFRGLNCPRAFRALGIRKFIKGFHWRGDALFGYNRSVQQNRLDQPWIAKTRRRGGEARPFGFYEVRAVDATETDNSYLHALLLDYGRGGNPPLDPTAGLRDYLVQLDDAGDHRAASAHSATC